MKVFALCAFLALNALAQGADLIASGNWVETITAANLIAGAGTDLQSQVESVPGITALTIDNAPGAWTLRARRTGGHGDVSVYVKRASGGSGSGSIVGGTAYIELTGNDVEVFSGSGDRSSISLQFKLAGISRNVSPATYLSSIIFTVQ